MIQRQTEAYGPTGYQDWWRQIDGHLGAIYPFVDDSDPASCSLDIGAIVAGRRGHGESVELDLVGLATKATLPYLLGNRTLLKGVSRAPWMSQREEAGGWEQLALPPHGYEHPDRDRFTRELKSALLEEAREYVGRARMVGILPSGGMDSRVVAGVVRALQDEADDAFNVVGLTRGKETSRDVVYARRIVERFGWDWQHFPITAETLHDNIHYAGKLGAEVSPLHLHAMPLVVELAGLDVVLAGSYGDMVGRAEFSGRHVTELNSVLPRDLDRFGVVRSSALRHALDHLKADASVLPHESDAVQSLRCREIEQHKHYTRRMLQSCMQSIALEKPIYQMFTSPRVFGRMWQLEPGIRRDDWYKRLLPLLPGDLMNIPWARTGKRYDDPSGTPDNYDRRHHSYGRWLRSDLRDLIIEHVRSDRIQALELFNDRALKGALRAWARAGTSSTNSLDELFSWMASLDEFLRVYNISSQQSVSSSPLADSFRAIRGGSFARAYIAARERVRD